jgi:hypothetical protein
MNRTICKTQPGRQWVYFGLFALSMFLLAISSIPSAAQKGGPPVPPAPPAGWRVELEEGQKHFSTLAIRNICKRPHSFRVQEKINYLTFAEPTADLLVPPASTRAIKALFDATGLKSKTYHDKVIVDCLDCKKEKGCSQDRDEIPVELIVTKPKQSVETQRTANTGSQILNRVALNCIPRGGRFCDGPGFSCLVMFPSTDGWPANITKSSEVEKQSLPGTAYVSEGTRPSLNYEFASSPSSEVRTFPLDRDITLDNKVSNSLGYSSVTILKGKYEVDRKKGKFGGLVFNIRVTGRTVRDDEIGILHNEALAFLYKHPDFLKILAGKKKGVFTFREVSQIQDLLKQFALGKGFSEAETNNASDSLNRFLADVGAINSREEIRINNQSTAKAQPIPILAAQKGYLSLTVAKEIVKVQQMATDKKELKVVLEYIEKQVRPRLREKDDIRRIDLFVNVCNNSRQFWGSQPQGLKKGTGTIIADAVGGIYGSLLPGIGTIIYAAIFSVIANESD